ncbi:penicillin-binding protein [Streptococcus sp. zg-86]|uniref:Penicillin-binding protein n=1 Tax=Streptococcus zhangguiae TaxID=2664091 RepID=A0A6I4R7T7_9STRE|nr:MULTISPECIES: penicillin-binding protein PBP1B [unclassified Streptococcus]MTB63864.1 penicillin-binding protein [Streptococcus sp. zg-86]MTB90174.1 penicillin-binding protein [Streptococcus sp. zg-36]MWV55846.1 penicillin-binding protein [Streptococcus sp. zg-70]QTH47874.1 penicillin-binding protein PBP1B [Streptococcus sp. zg-86]
MTTKLPKKKEAESSFTISDIAGIGLRTLKLLVDFGAILLFLLGVLGAGLGLGYVASLFDSVEVPNTTELVKDVTEVSRISKVVYADGSLVSEISSDLLRTPVEADAISENVKKAVIATEDVTFETHNGVVPKAVLRAALGSAGVGSSSGGSTLTQQLIKQQIVGDAPTFRRKANEIISALALERAMSKEEILTTYLNVSPFGRNNQGRNIAGIEEAARGIFGKSAKELTVPQAAFIAGLPQSPIVYSPYSSSGGFKSDEAMAYGIERSKDVLYNMYRAGYINEADYETYLAYDIKKDFVPPAPILKDTRDYLYYAVLSEAEEIMYRYLIKRDQVSAYDLKNDKTVKSYEDLAKQTLSQGGYTVTSTVQKNIYDAMQSVVANYGDVLDSGGGLVETGSVLLDNNTGAILGFVGGRDYHVNQNNHALNTKRSPGSTIKPFLAYGVAIDQGLMGSASILSNYPTTFSDGTPIMHVNSNGTGMMTLQSALNSSANIPAFWTYKMLRNEGVDVKSYMDKMNYDIDLYDIESLPLGGGVETTVAANTNAYQALANGGVYNEHYIVEKITAHDGTVIYQHEANPVQVYSKATSSIMMMLLRTALASGETSTFPGRLASINSQAAASDIVGKTGTSNDTADVWLMLATRQITLGTWAGHDDNSGMELLTGYHNNAAYVAYLTSALYEVRPDLFAGRFQLDDSVIASSVLTSTGTRPGTVQVNGSPITLGGAMTTSYWARNGAPIANYHFMIGGTNNDYAKAWSALRPAPPKPTPKSSSSTSSSSTTTSSTTKPEVNSSDSNR